MFVSLLVKEKEVLVSVLAPIVTVFVENVVDSLVLDLSASVVICAVEISSVEIEVLENLLSGVNVDEKEE